MEKGSTVEHFLIKIVMVSDERLGSSSTSNLVHHGSLDFGEVTAVQETADVANNLRAGTENFAGAVVHDKIQVALTEALLLILEAVVLGGDGVQTGRQEDDLGSEDRQLTIVTVLGGSASRETDNTDNVASTEVLVLLLEWDTASGVLCLAHNLDLLALGADVVENELGTRRALGIDTASKSDGDIGLLLALLKAFVLLQEVAQIGGDLELVGEWVRFLGFEHLLDLPASDFKVLLNRYREIG